jgi:hypothetical protein
MRKVASSRGWWVRAFAPLVALLGIGMGCSSVGFKSYPVKGKVVAAKAADQDKLKGLGVEFDSVAEPNTRGYGVLEADGSFTVSTYRLGETAPGAIEGKHKVRLQFTATDDDSDQPRRKRLPIDRKYMRFDTTPWEVTVPVTGDVLLELK